MCGGQRHSNSFKYLVFGQQHYIIDGVLENGIRQIEYTSCGKAIGNRVGIIENYNFSLFPGIIEGWGILSLYANYLDIGLECTRCFYKRCAACTAADRTNDCINFRQVLTDLQSHGGQAVQDFRFVALLDIIITCTVSKLIAV